MARGDQLGRQWKIIQTLISSRRGKSAAELAEALRRPGLNILWATLLGLLTLWVIGWVPFLGSLVKAVVLVLGFGGVLATIFSSVNRQREERVI